MRGKGEEHWKLIVKGRCYEETKRALLQFYGGVPMSMLFTA